MVIGAHQRRALIAESKEFDMMGRIHGDIFFQEKYLLNKVGMKTKLIRSNDNFCLMGAADAKTRRNARFADCAQSKTVAIGAPSHAKNLETATAKYPIKRVVCKSFQMPEN